MKIVETNQIYGAKDVSDEVSIENDEAELKYLTVKTDYQWSHSSNSMRRM